MLNSICECARKDDKVKDNLKCLLVYVFLFVAFKAYAIESMEALELLDMYTETRNKMQSVILTGKCLTESNHSSRGQRLGREEYEIGTDGDRVGLRQYSWRDFESFEGSFENDNATFRDYVWNREKCFDYARRGSSAGRAFVAHDDTSKQHRMAIGYKGAPLLGTMSGDDLRVDEILRNAKSLKVRGELEEVNGSGCYVVDAMTRHGRYSVWLDPEHGYNIARAEVTKEGADIAWSKPLNWKSSMKIPQSNRVGLLPVTKQSYSFSLKNVVFKEIEGVWVPMSADYESTSLYEDGAVSTLKNQCTQIHIDINPDFEAAGTFEPKIENDAAVFIKGVNFVYRWADGELVPNIDEYAVDVLEAEIECIKQNDDVIFGKTSKPADEEEALQLSETDSGPSIDNANNVISNTPPPTRSLHLKTILSIIAVVAVSILVYRWKKSQQLETTGN